MIKERHPWEWTEFTQVAARRHPDRIYATLNPKGSFVINIKTFERMNEPEAVVFVYDRRSQTLGRKPAKSSVPHALSVRTRHSRYNKVIRCVRFLKEHDIRLERTVQFPTAHLDRRGTLILNLKERVAAGHMPWKPKRK